MLAGRAVALVVVAWLAAGAQGAAWKFVVAGDSRSGSTSGGATQVNTGIVTEIGAAAFAEGAAFLLATGDLVNSGSSTANNAAAFTAYKNAITAGGMGINSIYPVMGNHDFTSSNYSTGSDAEYKAAFNYLPANGPAGIEQVRTYAATVNNALILGLDQYVSPYRVNQSWIDAQLSAPGRAPHVFAFGHIPAFQVTTHHTDTLDDYAANRNTFWTSLRNAGARVYFAGHEHFYDRTRLDDGDGNPNNDLYQLVVGTSGAPLTTNAVAYNNTAAAPYTPVQQSHDASYGYLLVTVDGDNVTMQWKRRTAANTFTVMDTFSYSIPEPATAAVLALGLLLAAARRTRSA